MNLVKCSNGHFYDSDRYEECPHCEKKIPDSAGKSFGEPDFVPKMFGEDELCDDYTGKCGNCHADMEDGDRFCRYCGTPRGEGAFLPYNNEVLCIYAPPMETRHKCKKCGYSWVRSRLGVDNAEFCPKCRGKLKTKYKNSLF